MVSAVCIAKAVSGRKSDYKAQPGGKREAAVHCVFMGKFKQLRLAREYCWHKWASERLCLCVCIWEVAWHT
jgi:hypothetical protein